MDRRAYYLQRAQEAAGMANHAPAAARSGLLEAARAWMVLFEVEEQRLGLSAPTEPPEPAPETPA